MTRCLTEAMRFSMALQSNEDSTVVVVIGRSTGEFHLILPEAGEG